MLLFGRVIVDRYMHARLYVRVIVASQAIPDVYQDEVYVP